jgi:hypothetical protein
MENKGEIRVMFTWQETVHTYITILADYQAWPAPPSDRNSVVIKLKCKNGDSSDFK